MKNFIAFGLILLIGSTTLVYTQAGGSSDALAVERFALYIAANDGGANREQLRYAVSDAQRLAQTLEEVGGVENRNSVILTDPGRRQIHEAFDLFTRKIEERKGKARRTEFILYYSGHSDETSLLMGGETFSYSELKESLSRVPSDVHVVMLDSCFSGSFVRAKGGSRQQPFLMDDSSEVKGHAYLSSSSETESSQESDLIQASFFTHSLITGLRGAADSSGDRKVSLNELYHYAFNDTLSKTEDSSYGPQHPSFNITMVGSGDLVLTDISNADSVIVFPSQAEGRYFVRTKEGVLVSELNKIAGTEIVLALPHGSYSITLVTPLSTSQAQVTLRENEHFVMGATQFLGVPRYYGRPRGGTSPDEEFAAIEEWTPFIFSVIPSVNFPRGRATENVQVSLGLLSSRNTNIRGIQASGLAGFIDGYMEGAQLSTLFNVSRGGFKGAQATYLANMTYGGPVQGAQISGFMNFSGDEFRGVQIAGFMNVANGPVSGTQLSGFTNVATNDIKGTQVAGFMNFSATKIEGVQAAAMLNIANEVDGMQIGLVNIARSNSFASFGLLNIVLDGILDPSIGLDTNGNLWFQYQGGTRLFYTTLFAGYDTGWSADHEPETAFLGIGAGTRLRASRWLSFDFEVLSRAVLDVSDNNIYMEKIRDGDKIAIHTDEDREDVYNAFVQGFIPSVRVTVNGHLLKHLAVFAAVNLDIKIKGFNQGVFDDDTHDMNFEFDEDSVWLYPSLVFGLKF